MTGRVPLSFIAAILGALVLGGAVGWLLAVRSLQRTPLSVVEDTRPAVPVLTLDGIEGGAVVGSVQGDVRIFADGKAIPVAADGPVRIPLASLPAVVTLQVPEGMRFVASKNGRKYYDVESSDAKKILPENRVYFRTEAEAEAAGYRR